MKTLINKYLQIRTTPPIQIIITNKTTLLLMTLFLLFIQSTQAKTKLTGNFLINNTISSIPLEREEGIIYNNKSEKEGDVTSISNDSKNTSKNSTFREVANDDFKSIEEGSNTSQFYYILEQNFKNAISLENISVANQPFPNPDTDGDGVTDDIDVDGLDDNFDNYDDTNISGHTVNNGINPPSASNLGDSDNDLATGGDVDFRDNVNTILITQVYQSAGKKMIEVTNIGAGQIPGGTFTLNLFSNNSGDMTGLTPSASYTITSTLNANQSIVIENNAGGGFSNINSGAISITDDTITNFSDGNDILVLSTTSDNTSWTNRLDVIHSVNNITSMVLKDEESNPVAANDPDRWSVFIDDNLDPYRPDTVGGAERHPHDPLMSEILNASENSNMQLGYHRSGETVRIAGAWNNGIPDRSRRVIINEDYLHNDGSTYQLDN